MKKITLTNGLVTLVDDDDYEDLTRFRWYPLKNRYAMTSIKTEKGHSSYQMHRHLMGLLIGDKRQVDHIDGNGLNNQRSNLRICSHSENVRNRGMHRTNRSGYKGVYPIKTGVWGAVIEVNGKSKYLGRFNTAEEAHEVYCLAADMLHMDFANYGR